MSVENILILLCLLCSGRVLLLVKYDLVLRYEARVNALRASRFFTGPQVQLLHSGVANASSKSMPVSKEYDNFNRPVSNCAATKEQSRGSVE